LHKLKLHDDAPGTSCHNTDGYIQREYLHPRSWYKQNFLASVHVERNDYRGKVKQK